MGPQIEKMEEPVSIEANECVIPDSSVTDASGHNLRSNSNTSVQPNVLLRTGVFTPVGRRTSKDTVEMDLSDELRTLELCKKEGYDHVQVRGDKLNVETDFKVWCGIVLAFTKYGASTNLISFKFSEFAKLCAYPSRRFDKNLRRQIGDSLERIQSQKLTLKRKNAVKAVHTGLLLKAEYDEEADTISLMADESLWDLYRLDYQVLVSIKVLEKLPRAEVAQCLYLYFLSLPSNPVPVSFERLRDRLQLQSSLKEANRKIKNGILKLESIGFLSGSFLKKGNETYYSIDGRSKKLNASTSPN